MYSIIFVAILYTVADRFHDQNINVAALIFTDVSTVQTEILQKMGRGVTFWNGYGAYTNHPKKILFCAVNKYEIGGAAGNYSRAGSQCLRHILCRSSDPWRI